MMDGGGDDNDDASIRKVMMIRKWDEDRESFCDHDYDPHCKMTMIIVIMTIIDRDDHYSNSPAADNDDICQMPRKWDEAGSRESGVGRQD